MPCNCALHQRVQLCCACIDYTRLTSCLCTQLCRAAQDEEKQNKDKSFVLSTFDNLCCRSLSRHSTGLWAMMRNRQLLMLSCFGSIPSPSTGDTPTHCEPCSCFALLKSSSNTFQQSNTNFTARLYSSSIDPSSSLAVLLVCINLQNNLWQFNRAN